MKRILFLFLLIPALSKAQVVVKAPTTLVKIKGGLWIEELQRSIVASDTIYGFVFRNSNYANLVDIKSIHFSKEELKKFSKGLETAQAAEKGDRIMLDKCALVKDKGMGMVYYTFYYDNGTCNLYQKDLTKLIEAIAKE